jgi:hypothetical protein
MGGGGGVIFNGMRKQYPILFIAITFNTF